VRCIVVVCIYHSSENSSHLWVLAYGEMSFIGLSPSFSGTSTWVVDSICIDSVVEL